MAAGEVVKRETFWGVFNHKIKKWNRHAIDEKRCRMSFAEAQDVAEDLRGRGTYYADAWYARPFTVVTCKKLVIKLDMPISQHGGLCGYDTLIAPRLKGHRSAEVIIRVK